MTLAYVRHLTEHLRCLGYDRCPLWGNRYEQPTDETGFQAKLATKTPEEPKKNH